MYQEEKYIIMEQIIYGISAKLNEKVTKQQFLKESGIFLIVGVVSPTFLIKLINKKRLTIDGDNIFLDDELLISRRED